MAYFPMYIELEATSCLVVGGGSVALRKVQVLRDFGAKVTVVAPQIIDEIAQIEDIHKIIRCFESEDLNQMNLVVAATDDVKQNHQIAQLCKEQKIPVNAVDQVEDCTFIFPSYVKRGEVTAAITSGGQSPVITQYLKRRIGEIMPDNIEEMAQALGSIRPRIKGSLDTEAQRKQVYNTLLAQMLEQGTLFSEEDVEQAVKQATEGTK